MNKERLDRIRLLSARFHELQGLRLAFAGVCLTVGMGGYLTATPNPTDSGALIAVAASFLPVIAAMPWLNRYYATTFGRQTRRRTRYAALFLILYFVIAGSLHVSILSIPAGAPTLATVVLVSLFVAIRDWPWRAYYVGAAAAVVIGFAVSASGVATVFLLLGASFIPIGLFDHLLLVKLMKEARPAGARATE
jgi:hypothetical protein